MKRSVSLLVVLLYLFLFSCQDKYLMGYTPAATGSLQTDVNTDCLPKTIAGIFVAGKDITDSNFLLVTVHVKTAGTYTVHTNTVNGFSFTATGTFTAAGYTQVKLPASGKPISAGFTDFSVQFDGSVCHAGITVLPPGGGAGIPAVYSFNGAPGACANILVSGSFVKGILLDTFSKISVQLTVTTPGAYQISTNTVNGYSFAAKGNFTSTGLQTLDLFASGTPAVTGVDQFTLNGAASSCSFPVTVLTAIAVSNTDHFPLRGGSYWTYDDLFNSGDTLSRAITDSLMTNGSLYKQLQEQLKFGAPVPYLYRKQDSAYYEYTSVDKYTLSVKFNPKIIKDFPFLREYLATGDTWTTEEYIGLADFGQQIYLRYNFTCINSNAAVTINGKTFAGVYKIRMNPMIRSAPSYPYNSTGEHIDIWYARGVGAVYSKKLNNNFTIFENQIRYWLVK